MSALAQISWSPKGYVPGDDVEEVLARAQFFLDNGMQVLYVCIYVCMYYYKYQISTWLEVAMYIYVRMYQFS